MKTLILNADAQPLSILPLSIVDWEEAIKLVTLNRVDIIHEYDFEVHSPSTTMKVPSVLMLKDYIKYDKSIKFSKYNLYLRDLFECQYCGVKFPSHHLTLDHVIPRFLGGKTTWNNSVASCEECNIKKANKTNIKPKINPYKPNYYDLINKRKQFPVYIHDKIWEKYLDWNENLIMEVN